VRDAQADQLVDAVDGGLGERHHLERARVVHQNVEASPPADSGVDDRVVNVRGAGQRDG
jgi:hypothetical protein